MASNLWIIKTKFDFFLTYLIVDALLPVLPKNRRQLSYFTWTLTFFAFLERSPPSKSKTCNILNCFRVTLQFKKKLNDTLALNFWHDVRIFWYKNILKNLISSVLFFWFNLKNQATKWPLCTERNELWLKKRYIYKHAGGIHYKGASLPAF